MANHFSFRENLVVVWEDYCIFHMTHPTPQIRDQPPSIFKSSLLAQFLIGYLQTLWILLFMYILLAPTALRSNYYYFWFSNFHPSHSCPPDDRTNCKLTVEHRRPWKYLQAFSSMQWRCRKPLVMLCALHGGEYVVWVFQAAEFNKVLKTSHLLWTEKL